MSSEQQGEGHAWPRAALSAHPGYAETVPGPGVPAEDPSGAQCKYPGCRRPRQARVNRRGAPPAYCGDPRHEPDAARRERRRRLREGLALNAALDENDQQAAAFDGPQSVPARPALPQPRAALEPGAAPVRTVTTEDDDEFDELGSAPAAGEPSRPAADLATTGRSAPGSGLGPAEQARRLADQLALAAEAYEQLAGAVAARDAENAELRRRLQHAEQALRDHLDGRPPH